MDIDALSQQDWNFKSKLIDWGQKTKCKVMFEVVNTINPNKKNSNRKEYEVRTLIDNKPGESAIEYSIKAAEQLAAEKTFKKLVEEGRITIQQDK